MLKGIYKKVSVRITIFAIIFVAVFPYLWLVLTSLKTRVQAQSIPPKWLIHPTLDNYVDAFISGPFSQNLMNSMIVSALSTLIALAIALPGAYAFSQLSFRGDRHYLFFILATRMAPPVSLALPLYALFTVFHLRDTHVGLALAHATFNTSFSIWMLKGFFDSVPKDIIDAARIDGLSHFVIFTRIMRPLIMPGVIVTAIFCIIFSWNDFFFAKVLTDQNGTLPIALLGLETVHGTRWGEVAAVCTIITLPLIIFAWIVQKHIVRGMTYGLVK